MRYYNQTNYPHVPYPTLTDLPELGRSDTTVRDAGCGLCASCMANHSPGTDLSVLGPYIAERFDLDLVITDDPELLRAHLKKGYMAVACSAGDRPEEDYIGVFSHGGHFIAVVGIEEDGEHITVLDPSLMPDKYQEDGRRDKVIVNGNVLHTTMKVLAEDCRYREIKYYADGDFKKWLEQEEPDANKDRYFLFSPKASESR